MSVIAIALFAAAVLAYTASSNALERRHVTAAMVFVVVGSGIGIALAHSPDPAAVRTLAELTLALVLFHDAAELQPRQLTRDVGLCARLLPWAATSRTCMATPTGLEPATSAVTGRRANQLRYGAWNPVNRVVAWCCVPPTGFEPVLPP